MKIVNLYIKRILKIFKNTCIFIYKPNYKNDNICKFIKTFSDIFFSVLLFCFLQMYLRDKKKKKVSCIRRWHCFAWEECNQWWNRGMGVFQTGFSFQHNDKKVKYVQQIRQLKNESIKFK